jgi:hypothetical protein
LKTWIFKTPCKDTADPACYCKHPEFIKEIIDCLDSHSNDDSEAAKAINYLAGLCAPVVPQNPGCVIGNVPDRITLTPPKSVATTTIVATVTHTVPCAPTVISGTTVSSTVKVEPTTVTIPQISIQPTDVNPTLLVPSQVVSVPATAAPTAPNTVVPTTSAVPTTLVTRPIGTQPNATSTGIPPITFNGEASGLRASVFALVAAGVIAMIQL